MFHLLFYGTYVPFGLWLTVYPASTNGAGVTRSCYAPGASFNRWLYWYNAANRAFAAIHPNIFLPEENLRPAITTLGFPKPSLWMPDSGLEFPDSSLDLPKSSLDLGEPNLRVERSALDSANSSLDF
jgi:hypothetical protein